MYHYVRPKNNWDGIVPLSPELFSKQIDFLSRQYDIISVNQIFESRSRPWCVLTFDDGTKDQYTYAFDILKKKGVPAHFSVMSGPALTQNIPVVHLVHTVLSFKSDEEIWSLLSNSFDTHGIEQASQIYNYESNKLRRYNKYMLNFKLSAEESSLFLEQIFFTLFPDKASFIQEFYLNESEIIKMDKEGMSIGVHCHNHKPYNSDPIHFYEEEIKPCKVWLQQILNQKSFWYTPAFGGKNLSESYVEELSQVLMMNQFKGGFTTRQGYISNISSFWLNRVDCNKFVGV